MKNPNAQKLDEEFLAPVGEVAGLKLQTFSAATLTACRKLELTLVVGSEDAKATLSQEEQQFEIMTLLWLLASPRREIKAKVALGREGIKETIEDFEALIPLEEIPNAAKEINKIMTGVAAAVVEVTEKPTPDGAPTPPPNS